MVSIVVSCYIYVAFFAADDDWEPFQFSAYKGLIRLFIGRRPTG
jgi:hypothetical protein